MKSVHIATVAVMVIAAFKASIGEDAVEDFAVLPEPQKKSLLDGIEMLVADPDAGPEARHSAWVDGMLTDGWALGDEINEQNKTHPMLMSFDELPESEQIKEKLLHAVVRSMSSGEMANDIAAPVAQPAPAVVHGNINVKYIGSREEHHDNLYGSNLKWKPGSSHGVPAAIAEKMRAHTDTYEVGKAVVVTAEVKKADLKQPDKLPVPLPNLDGMEKSDLIAFAQQHYGENLPANMKVENMRNKILTLIQSQGR